MAEFASAIVGLAAVGAKVGNSLYGLIDTLKDAPAEFLALSDEVTDFRSIVSQYLEHAGTVGHNDERNLGCARENGGKILKDIEQLVAEVVKERKKGAEPYKVDRVRWLRQVKKAQKFQGLLRVQKASICNFLALEILKSSSQQGLRIASLETKIEGISQRQLSFGEKQEKSLEAIELFNQSRPRIGTLEPAKHPIPDTAVLPSHFGVSAMTGKRTKSPALTCLEDCRCRCHFRAIVRSPRYVSEYLGDFILGCSNLPWCFSGLVQCSEQSCRRSRRSTSELKYFLPTWFGNAVAGLSLTLNIGCLPLTLNIHSRHTIPYDSPIFVCTQDGDVDGIRRLLRSGTASLNDVDPYGLGLLYYAAYYCWRACGKDSAIRTSQFLIDMGAHLEWEDEIGNTPMETMIDDTIVSLAANYRDSRPPKVCDFVHISLLFDVPAVDIIGDLVDDREFTTIHQVMLGIRRDLGTLDQFLSRFCQDPANAEIIDTPDARGRSPLSWAVEYGWENSVRTLLQFGASPHQTRQSLHGKSPLLHLAIAGPALNSPENPTIRTVQLLLQAGVDVNSVDHEGWTPLHVAASWNNYGVIKALAAYGGYSLLWNSLTDNGESAIDLALDGGFNTQVQRILLKHEDVGADAEPSEYLSECDSDEFVDCVE